MANKLNNLYAFGDFILDGEKRVLWRGEELVSLPPKVFDTLFVLVERQGDVVSKDEIFETVWADSFVEENNLSQNIFALRRALDGKNEESIIETVPRKGFRITEKIRLIEDQTFTSALSQDHSSGQEILIATETETRVIEEIIIEDDGANKLTPALTGKQANFFSNNKKWLLPVFGLLLLSAISYGSYWFFAHYQEDLAQSSRENLSIRSLTNTGDIDLPAISPNGKFAVYLKGVGDERVLQLRDIELETVTDLKIDGNLKPGFSRFSLDGKSIYFRDRLNANSSGKIYKVSYLGGTAKLVAENVWGLFSFSPDAKQIAYFRRIPRDNRYDLIVTDLKTGKDEIVLSRFAPKLFFVWSYPAFSPDGKKIAFIQRDQDLVTSSLIIADIESRKGSVFETPKLVAFRRIEWVSPNKILAVARARREIPQLHQISYPGGKSTPITKDLTTYRSLSVSADGRSIISKTVEAVSNVWILPAGNLENAKKITEDNFGRDGFFGIRWTPEGKVVFVSRSDRSRNLWLLNPANEVREQLTKNTGNINQTPSVSADGKSIYFNSNRSKRLKIWRIDSNGKNPTQITKGEKTQELSPVVSKDGKWLYYIKRSRKASSIWRKPVGEDKEEKVLTRAFSLENHISLSPNGKYLAFNFFGKDAKENAEESELDSKEKVGVLDLENQENFYTFDLTTVSRSIRWSDNGESFDYIENKPNGSKIWRRSVTDKESEPKLILELPVQNIFNFDWSANGKDLALSVGKNKQDAVILNLK